jgi:4-amino-4-deoxy-L-arabinose transferase-like glycosyltransferase
MNEQARARVAPVILLLVAVALAHILLFAAGIPPVLGSLAALALGAFIPGLLLVHLLFAAGRTAFARAEHALLGLAAGLMLYTWAILFAAYLPGPLSRTGLIVAFDLLNAGLALALLRRRAPPPLPATLHVFTRRQAVAALALLLLAAALRLVNLGYSEFQGDEATPLVRAVLLAQGEDDLLFRQPRGPVEMLLPAATAALAGVTEASVRLPFTLANLVLVGLLFLLAWRLRGPLAAWAASLLLIFDGFLLAFARTMKYESMILLGGVLAVYALYALLAAQRSRAHAGALAWRLLPLSAVAAATGILAHYDGLIALVPCAWLALLIWREGKEQPVPCSVFAAALALGAALLVSFYLPFVLHPSFGDTVAHYAARLPGGESSTWIGSLQVFAENAVLYDGPALFYALTFATVGLAVTRLWRGGRWTRPVAVAALLLLAAGVLLPAADATLYNLLTLGLYVLLAGVLLAPRLVPDERLLWLWFAAPFAIAVLLVKNPGFHYPPIVPAWSLLAAWAAADLWDWLGRRVPARVLRPAAATLAVLFVAAATTYSVRFFVRAGDWSARPLREFSPPPLWPTDAFSGPRLYSFGRPHRAGWKSAGALMVDGTLRGSYASNADPWVTEWYLRGAPRCEQHADVALIELSARPDRIADLWDELGEGYTPWGSVVVGGAPQLDIFTRAAPDAFAGVEDDGSRFDALAVRLPLRRSEILAPPALEPVGARFGDAIELVAASVTPASLAAGQPFYATIEWRARAPVAADYTLSLQLADGAGNTVAQWDTMPGCNNGPTSDWEPGERVLGEYVLWPDAGAAAGAYTLSARLYDVVTHDLLSVYGADGAPLSDALHLGDVTILP